MIKNDQECETLFNRIQILKLVKPDANMEKNTRETIQAELDEAIVAMTKEMDDYNNQSYPDGKLNEFDEGELEIKFGIENETVVIDFGKPTQWIGFPPDKAVEFALLIIKQVKVIKPVTIELP